MKNYKNISKTLLKRLGAVGLLTFLLSSCLKTTSSDYVTTPVSLLQVVQAAPDQPALDFYLNSDKVNFGGLVYGQYIDYFRAFAGKRTYSFYLQGTTNQLLSDTVTLHANTTYSMFLTGTTSKPEVVLLTDTLNQPAAGTATVRFINLSPDSPPATLAVQGGDVLANDIHYKGHTTFKSVPAKANYTFEVRQGDTNTVLATLSNVTLQAGFVYTVWYHGLVAHINDTDKLAASIINNAYFY